MNPFCREGILCHPSKKHRKGANYTKEGWSIIHKCGIYDCNTPYKWREKILGKTVVIHCPYFVKWKSILLKSHCHKFKARNPAYRYTTMCDSWLYFSSFKRWVDNQPNNDWKERDIDKDLLFIGNNHYSPNTCCFLSRKLNGFLKYVKKRRGDCMIGVSYKEGNGKNRYQADCSDPFTRQKVYIGSYKTEIEAHLAWKAYKHKLALIFAEQESDERVIAALVSRYKPETDWTDK